MLIQLKAPVRVRRDDGTWVDLPMDTFVNYNSRMDGDSMVHRFTCSVYGDHIGHTVECVVVTGRSENPPWL